MQNLSNQVQDNIYQLWEALMYRRQKFNVSNTYRMIERSDIDFYLDNTELATMDIIIDAIISEQLKFYGEGVFLGIYFTNEKIDGFEPISDCKMYNKHFIEVSHYENGLYDLTSNKLLPSKLNIIVNED